MSEPKLCKDCKYAPEFADYQDMRLYYDIAFCNHKEGRGTNLVNGETYQHACKDMRHDDDFCGQDGAYFEPRSEDVLSES